MPKESSNPWTFHIATLSGKVFLPLEGDLLHSPCRKKSSNLMSENFNIATLLGKVFLALERDLLCTFPDAEKVFRYLERNLLHSPLPEKSSDPWSETSYIPPFRKSLPIPGAKSFTFPQARKVFQSLERDLLQKKACSVQSRLSELLVLFMQMYPYICLYVVQYQLATQIAV
jgi:hypothetical protein